MGRHNRAHQVDSHKDGSLAGGAPPTDDASDRIDVGPAQGSDTEGLDAEAIAAHANSRATAFIAAHPIVTVLGAITAGFVIGRILSRA